MAVVGRQSDSISHASGTPRLPPAHAADGQGEAGKDQESVRGS
jgi:hypothetical protein